MVGRIVGRLHVVEWNMERVHVVGIDVVRQHMVGQHVVGQHVVRQHLVRIDVVRCHLVGLDVVRIDVVRKHLVGKYLVGEHMVGLDVVRFVVVERRMGRRVALMNSHARNPFRGPPAIWAFNAALFLTAAVLFFTRVRGIHAHGRPFALPFLALVAMYALSEVFVAHFPFRRQAYSFSLSEVPLVLGLFFAKPEEVVLAAVLGVAGALVLHRRQAAVKAAFNIAKLAVELCIAVMIFWALFRPGALVSPGAWLATLTAALATAVVSNVMIGAAISLAEGSPQIDTTLKGLGMGVMVTTANTSLALVGATLLWQERRAGLLLVPPVVVMVIAYRAYSSQRTKTRRLESLYETTRLLQHSLEVDTTTRTLLERARMIAEAEIASIKLLPTADGPAIITTLGPGDEIRVETLPSLDPTEGVWARVAAEGQALLLARPIRNERLAEHFAARGIRDAMIAPLFDGRRVTGTMLVGNRLGDVSTFDAQDLTLFETLANHTSVSLSNARLVSWLQESLAHLTEINRLKDDFVATVSHELRTPLTSIKGFAKTLLRPDVSMDEDQRQFVAIIDRQADRLHRLIEDLLVVSRVEADQIRPLPAPVSPASLLDGLATEFEQATGDRRIDVLVERDLAPLSSDGDLIHRVLSNLVENALKYSPPGTAISLGARGESGGVVFSVADRGFGVPAERRDQIFERFYQVDQSATRRVGGAGLGLFICRKLASSLGGRVWLERSDENGSVFSLWIPGVPGARNVEAERPRLRVAT